MRKASVPILVSLLMPFFVLACGKAPEGLEAVSGREAAHPPPLGISEASAAGDNDEQGKTVPGREAVIEFDHTEYDFGEAAEGEEVVHIFPFKNTGSGVLRIDRVRTSCGCTAAVVREKEIPPGAAGEIKTKFQTRGYQGAVEKGLTVESNDPKRAQSRLTIRGKVISEFRIEPRSINWGTVRKGEPPRPVQLRIQMPKGKGLAVKAARSESSAVSLKRESEREEEVVYEVALTKDLPLGRLAGKIVIETNGRKSPQIAVPFYALIQGKVAASPEMVSFGLVPRGRPSTQEFLLMKTGEEDFTVRAVETTAKEIRTEIIPGGDGEGCRIRITYDPGDRPSGRISERLRIHLGNGEEEIMEVPVFGILRDGKEGAPH